MSTVKTIRLACATLVLGLLVVFAGGMPASAQATGTLLWWGGGGSGSAADGPGTWGTGGAGTTWLVEGDIPDPGGPGAWSPTPWINDGTWDAQIGWGGTPATIVVTAPTPVNVYNIMFGGPTGQSYQNDSAHYTVTGGTLNLSGGVITVNSSSGAGVSVINSTLTGTNGLYKTGSGALALGGVTAYSGATTINAGTLQIGNGGATGSLPTSSPITDNGALVFNRGNTTVTQGTDFSGGGITGNGSLAQAGFGTLVLNAANGYAGGTTTSGNLVLDFTAAGAPTSNILAAAGALTLNGVTLNVNGGTSGTTSQTVASLTVNPGSNTISLTNNGATSTSLAITSGAVTRSTAGTFLNFVAPAGTSVTLGSGANAFLGPWAFFNGTNYAATGAGGVVQAATPAAAAGVNGFTSATANYAYTSPGSFDALTGNATANTAIFATASDQVIDLGPGTLTMNGFINNGGALTIQSNAGTGILNIGSSQELIVGGTSNVNISVPIADNAAGASALTVFNAGTVTLSGANTYTGPTTVNAGTLVLAGNNSARPAAINGLTTVNSGGTLQLQANLGNIVNGTSFALSAEQTANQPLVLNNGATLQLRSDYSVTFAGGNNFGGPSGAAITIDVDQATALGSNQTLTLAPGGFTTNNTTINVTGGDGYTLALGPVTNGNNGSLTLNTTANASLVAVPASVTSFTKGGPGTLVLAGTSFTSTGPTTINGGCLTISGNGIVSGNYSINNSITQTSAIFLSNGGTLQIADPSNNGYTLAASFSGTGTLLKSGVNVWDMSSQRGAIISLGSGSLIDVEGGGIITAFGGYNWSGNKASLNVAANTTFNLWDSLASNPVIVNALTGAGMVEETSGGQAGLTVGIDNGSGTFSGTIKQVASLTKTGSGTQVVNGVLNYSGSTTINGGQLTIGGNGNQNVNALSITNSSLVTFSGNGNLNSGAVSFASGGTLQIANGSNNDYMAATSFTGTGTVVKTSANGWCLSSVTGANISFGSGSLIDVEGGALLAAYNGYNWSANKAALNVAGGATFDLWDSYATNPVIVDALTGAGTIQETYGGQAGLTVGIDNGSGTFSGTITQVASLTKAGSGAETLSGTLSYSGPTTVSGGQLTFSGNGNMSTNAISITNGGTLQIANATNDAFVAAASISGTGVFLKSGPNAWCMSNQRGANISFGPGSLIDVEGGALLAAYNGYNWSGNQASLNVAGGATFDLWDSYATNPVIVDALTGAGTVRENYGGSAGLTVGIDNGSGTFSGTITQIAGLTKTGSGMLVLSGTDNTYGGGTDVENGVLDVANSNAIPYGSGLIVGTSGTVVLDSSGLGAVMVAKSSPAVSPAGVVAAVPEPGSLALLAVALWSAAACYRFSKRSGPRQTNR